MPSCRPCCYGCRYPRAPPPSLGSIETLEMVDLVNARPQALGKLRDVAGGPDMHVVEVRLVTECVVVQGRHLYAVVHEHVQDVVHLQLAQHEVAGHGGTTPAERLEGEGRAHAHRGRNHRAHIPDDVWARDAHREEPVYH